MTQIDWEQVRARLTASQSALETALAVSPERLEAVYRERAVALAARQASAASVGHQVLVFQLGAERYALDFGHLTGIMPFVGCTPVPGGAAELLGVMNIGGAIRSVIDLGGLIGLPAAQVATGYVLVIRFGGRETALRVGTLDRVRLVAPDESTTPAADARSDCRYVTGLTPDGVRILDTAAIFSHSLFHGSGPVTPERG